MRASLYTGPGIAANVSETRISINEFTVSMLCPQLAFEQENGIIASSRGRGRPAHRQSCMSRDPRRGDEMPDPDGKPLAGGVGVEVDAGVAIVTIDRPEVRNAIGFATIDELGAALDRVQESRAAVLVLRGGGDRVFVSGGDLKELNAIRTHEDAARMASRVRRILDRVAAFPVPVVAALNGHALGGGAEGAIAADIRIAAEDVKIGFNQVTLGIMPAWGGAERLVQAIGRSRALLAIATGELYDAGAAQRLGLVDIVVPRARFEEEWRALARRM